MLQRGGGQHPDAPVPLEPREAHRRRGRASRGGVPSSLALTAACHPRAEYLCDADKVLKRAGIHQGENLEIVHADGAVAVGGTSQPRGSLPDVQCLICYETSADYSALGCGQGELKGVDLRTCALAAERQSYCSMLGQWSARAFANDAAALVVMMLCVLGGAAVLPRRRLPVITRIGENGLICYLLSVPLVYFLAPALEVYLNCLVSMGLLEKRPSDF